MADWMDESGVGGENIAEAGMNLKNLEMSSGMDLSLNSWKEDPTKIIKHN